MARLLNTAAKEASFYTAITLLVVIAAFPFYWMLITAFKTNTDLYSVSNIPLWFNDHPGLFNALFFGGMGRVSLKCHTPTQTAL